MAVRLAGRVAAGIFFAVGAATVEDELACGFLGLGEVAEAGGGAGVFGGGLLASATGSGGPRTGSAQISGMQRLGGRWASVAAAPVHGAAPSPDPRGSGRCAQGRAQWQLRRPRAGLLLFLALGSVGGVRCSGACPRVSRVGLGGATCCGYGGAGQCPCRRWAVAGTPFSSSASPLSSSTLAWRRRRLLGSLDLAPRPHPVPLGRGGARGGACT